MKGLALTDVPALTFNGDLPGDDAEVLRLRECSTEPIRTIGAIQSHGILFAIDEVTGVVVAASANAESWLGRDLREAGSEMVTWSIGHGVAVDPVRAEFEGTLYDVIAHRGTSPLLLELEPVVPELEYVRTASSAPSSGSQASATRTSCAVRPPGRSRGSPATTG